jgi:hypothetical protein
MIEQIIQKLYNTNSIITTCCVKYQDYINNKTDYLPIRIKNKWIYDHKPPVKNYKQYSHTYCPEEFNKIKKQI